MKNIKEQVKGIIIFIDEDRRFTAAQTSVLRLLWVKWGRHYSQREIAQTEAWLGCHPEHEADIRHGRFDTTTRMVRQIIRDLRVVHNIPILSDRKGYWLPETKEECDKYMADMEGRAKAQAAAAVETFNAMSAATGFTSEVMKKLQLTIS
jgi:hypothetical protein